MTELQTKSTECVTSLKENLLESEMRLLRCETDEDDLTTKRTDMDDILKNGYRMNSNPSSPLFVPITHLDDEVDDDDDVTLNVKINLNEEKLQVEARTTNDIQEEISPEPENVIETKETEVKEEEPEVLGRVSYLTQDQLEAIQRIAVLKKVSFR